MTARYLIAAATLIVAGSAFAADAPATAGANAAVTAAAASSATANAAKLNLPVLQAATVRTREAVRAEAIEAVRNHKTTLSQQLEMTK
ncbi:hypothetical protein [Pseudoduganella sp. GCM10020061]|uniref:hypothetical protein n=1 Tax=Pseudoduganella sp. GCM10020061 TaxID=3317345 RepID=UPI0036350E6B